jgi:hypothetical protein
MAPLAFDDPDPASLTHAMARFQGMFDTVRDGAVAHGPADIPKDPQEHACHIEAAAYYFDASMVGIARLGAEHLLAEPFRNPVIDTLREEAEAGQPNTFAAGIDAIYADVLDTARRSHEPAHHHCSALVFLVEYTREPRPGEPGTERFAGKQAQRAALLAANVAVVLASCLRLLGVIGEQIRRLGHSARVHSVLDC